MTSLLTGKCPFLPAGRQEGAQYKENTLQGSHALPGVELPFYPVFPYSSRKLRCNERDLFINPEWQNIEDNVVKAAKILIKRRICEAFGHVSARLPDRNKKGDVGSQATHKYRFKEDTSSEFAALFTADVVTPKNRAIPAPGYPIFLTAN